MSQQTSPVRQWLEDFEQGFVSRYTVPGLSTEQIIAFATQYDPQRFHLDEAAAAATHFGGLVASGFQTQVACFRPFCDEVLVHANAIGSPGIDMLKWLRPWYPGEALDVAVSLVASRRASKRPDRGYLNFELRASANGAATLAMDWMVIMLARPT